MLSRVGATADLCVGSGTVWIASRWLGSRVPVEQIVNTYAFSAAPLVFYGLPHAEIPVWSYRVVLLAIGVARVSGLGSSRTAFAVGIPVVGPAAFALSLAVVLRTYVTESFEIPSGSNATNHEVAHELQKG